MPDRDNVIKAAENYEPYARVFTNLTVNGDLFINMLTLLKEKEPVEPIEIIDEKYPVGDHNRYKGYRCGKCQEVIPWDADYCPYCGQEVKWE